MKLLKKGQSGQALVMALIMLALGSLIAVPIVNLAGTSLTYNQVIQRNTLETYAADSGVEYALCEIGNDPEYYETEVLQASFIKNDRTVDVTAEYVNDYTYKVTSVATTDSNSSTTVESDVYIPPYPSFFSNGITSKGDVAIQPDGNVYGDVQYEGTLDNKGTIHGNEINAQVIGWPTADALSAFYWVESPVISESSIDVSSGTEANPYIIEQSRTTGNLDITGDGVAKLEGTLYVQGNLTFKTHSAIMLNGQTIFVAGDVEADFYTAPNTGIYGPGCIIAIGDIQFQPDILSSEGDYILIMSVSGMIDFQQLVSFRQL